MQDSPLDPALTGTLRSQMTEGEFDRRVKATAHLRSKPIPASEADRLDVFKARVALFWHQQSIGAMLMVCGQAMGVRLPPVPEILK